MEAPSVSTVKKFLSLLEQSDLDFSEEIGTEHYLMGAVRFRADFYAVCVCVCVCACVRACVRACVCACVRACAQLSAWEVVAVEKGPY